MYSVNFTALSGPIEIAVFVNGQLAKRARGTGQSDDPIHIGPINVDLTPFINPRENYIIITGSFLCGEEGIINVHGTFASLQPGHRHSVDIRTGTLADDVMSVRGGMAFYRSFIVIGEQKQIVPPAWNVRTPMGFGYFDPRNIGATVLHWARTSVGSWVKAMDETLSSGSPPSGGPGRRSDKGVR